MKHLIMSTFVAAVLGASALAPAVAEAGAPPTGGGVAAAKPAPTLNTYDDWRGASVGPFGRPQMSTIGQITQLVENKLQSSASAG